MRPYWMLFACALLTNSLPLVGDEALVQAPVFQAGQGGYASYRIPAAILTSKSTLLAFCEGRVRSSGDAGEIHLLLRRSTDAGRSFSAARVVWADGPNSCDNPCPVLDASTGTIHLLMTRSLGQDREKQIIAGTAAGTKTVWITSSTDDGVTWSKPRDITQQAGGPHWPWYATGPGIGIQLVHGPRAGRLVIPCDHIGLAGGAERANAHVIYSDDHGSTWHIGGSPPTSGFNESQVVELADGKLLLNMRNYGSNSRARGVSTSADGGETFGPAHADAKLIEPVCQASLFRYSWPTQGRSRILFANPASTTQRRNMTVRLSYDEGVSWPVERSIFDGPSAYSCLVALGDGSIGLLYECGEKSAYDRIDFARFTLSWLTHAKDSAPGRGE